MSDERKSIDVEIRKASIQLSSIIMRIEATQKLFDSAAFLGNGEASDVLRMELHALLDQRLDHNARIMQLTRQNMEL